MRRVIDGVDGKEAARISVHLLCAGKVVLKVTKVPLEGMPQPLEQVGTKFVGYNSPKYR